MKYAGSALLLSLAGGILCASAPLAPAQTSPSATSQDALKAFQPAPSRPDPISNTVAYTNSMEVLNNQAKLGNGDMVSYRVVEERKDPIPLVVTDSGEM